MPSSALADDKKVVASILMGIFLIMPIIMLEQLVYFEIVAGGAMIALGLTRAISTSAANGVLQGSAAGVFEDRAVVAAILLALFLIMPFVMLWEFLFLCLAAGHVLIFIRLGDLIWGRGHLIRTLRGVISPFLLLRRSQ